LWVNLGSGLEGVRMPTEGRAKAEYKREKWNLLYTSSLKERPLLFRIGKGKKRRERRRNKSRRLPILNPPKKVPEVYKKQ
jgi:hypothetical protein